MKLPELFKQKDAAIDYDQEVLRAAGSAEPGKPKSRMIEDLMKGARPFLEECYRTVRQDIHTLLRDDD